MTASVLDNTAVTAVTYGSTTTHNDKSLRIVPGTVGINIL